MEKSLRRYQLVPRFKITKERVFEIDFLRGLDIILMLIVHFVCDLGMLDSFLNPPEVQPEWIVTMQLLCSSIFNEIVNGSLFFLEFFFSGLFMFLCGISCAFAHSNFKRGIQLAYVAVFLSILLDVADALFGLNSHIYVGILHALAIGLLIYSLVDHFFPSYKADFLCGILFTILVGITSYYYCGSGAHLTNLDLANGNDWNQAWKLLFGLARAGDDYFSPLITTSLIFLGATVGKTIYRERKSLIKRDFKKGWAKPFLWIGNKTLYAYVLHQPVFYAFLALFFLPFGYHLF